MELILKRIAKKSDYTIGRLFIVKSEERRALGVKSEERRALGVKSEERRVKNSLAEEDEGKEDLEYFCDTLEPTWRNLHGIPLPKEMESRHLGRNSGVKARKVPGKTAIPEGRYPLLITKSYRFKQWLPLVFNVPGFSGIRIHAGNTAKDTQGCILLGENRKVGMVVNSRIWLHRFIEKFKEAREKDEAVFLTIE